MASARAERVSVRAGSAAHQVRGHTPCQRNVTTPIMFAQITFVATSSTARVANPHLPGAAGWSHDDTRREKSHCHHDADGRRL